MKSVERGLKRIFPSNLQENQLRGKLQRLTLEEKHSRENSLLLFLLEQGSEVNTEINNVNQVIAIPSEEGRGNREFEEILKSLLTFGTGVNSRVPFQFNDFYWKLHQYLLSRPLPNFFALTGINNYNCIPEVVSNTDTIVDGNDNFECDDDATFCTAAATLINLNGHSVNCEPFKGKAVPLHETMRLFQSPDSMQLDTASFLFFNGNQVNSPYFDADSDWDGQNVQPLHDALSI